MDKKTLDYMTSTVEGAKGFQESFDSVFPDIREDGGCICDNCRFQGGSCEPTWNMCDDFEGDYDE